jgi:hypothetical protein
MFEKLRAFFRKKVLPSIVHPKTFTLDDEEKETCQFDGSLWPKRYAICGKCGRPNWKP